MLFFLLIIYGWLLLCWWSEAVPSAWDLLCCSHSAHFSLSESLHPPYPSAWLLSFILFCHLASFSWELGPISNHLDYFVFLSCLFTLTTFICYILNKNTRRTNPLCLNLASCSFYSSIKFLKLFCWFILRFLKTCFCCYLGNSVLLLKHLCLQWLVWLIYVYKTKDLSL